MTGTGQVLERVGARLAALQAQADQTKEDLNGDLRDTARELVAVPELDLAKAFVQWICDMEDAFVLLLEAAVREPSIAVAFAAPLIREYKFVEVAPNLRPEVQRVFETALGESSPGLRSHVFQRCPSLKNSDFVEGRDYADLDAVQPTPWPMEKDFPEIGTPEGKQSRLNALEYWVGDPMGTWGPSSEAALVLYQIDNVQPCLGKWDESTEELLLGDAFVRQFEAWEESGEL